MYMKTIPFIKMHGLGNDYVYIDCFSKETAAIIAKTDLPELARRVSDRHFGIGSDGLVLIRPIQFADAQMRIFNADGSEAEMCGNAIRCVAKYLYECGLRKNLQMEIATLAGIRTLNLQVVNGIVEQVTVNMGVPSTTRCRSCLRTRILSLCACAITPNWTCGSLSGAAVRRWPVEQGLVLRL